MIRASRDNCPSVHTLYICKCHTQGSHFMWVTMGGSCTRPAEGLLIDIARALPPSHITCNGGRLLRTHGLCSTPWGEVADGCWAEDGKARSKGVCCLIPLLEIRCRFILSNYRLSDIATSGSPHQVWRSNGWAGCQRTDSDAATMAPQSSFQSFPGLKGRKAARHN